MDQQVTKIDRLMAECKKLREERNSFRRAVAEERATVARLGAELAQARCRIDELDNELSDLRHNPDISETIRRSTPAIKQGNEEERPVQKLTHSTPAGKKETNFAPKAFGREPKPQKRIKLEDSPDVEVISNIEPIFAGKPAQTALKSSNAASSQSDIHLRPKLSTTFVCEPEQPFLSRRSLSKIIGGSSSSTVVRIPTGSGVPKARVFVFPIHNLCPLLPRRVGESGRLHTVSTELLGLEKFSLFCTALDHRHEWQYKGEYRAIFSQYATVGDLEHNDGKLIRFWSKAIIADENCAVVCARILLRIEKEKITESSLKKKMREGVERLTLRDVLQSLERGEEEISVLNLECVGYDSSLVSRIIRMM